MLHPTNTFKRSEPAFEDPQPQMVTDQDQHGKGDDQRHGRGGHDRRGRFCVFDFLLFTKRHNHLGRRKAKGEDQGDGEYRREAEDLRHNNRQHRGQDHPHSGHPNQLKDIFLERGRGNRHPRGHQGSRQCGGSQALQRLVKPSG